MLLQFMTGKFGHMSYIELIDKFHYKEYNIIIK